MKVLHVFNQAGVASTLSRILNQERLADSRVITRKSLNAFGFEAEESNLGPRLFAARVALTALKSDIIHVHYGLSVHRALERLLPWKAHIMHFLGSDARGKTIKGDPNCLMLYSAPDIRDCLPSGAVYLPIPVDRKVFHAERKPEEGSALHFRYGADDLAREFAEKLGLSLTMLERNLPHSELPSILRRYEYYLDFRRVNGNVIRQRSATALQALASGAKAVDWDGTTVERFPQEHDAKEVAYQLADIYGEMSW